MDPDANLTEQRRLAARLVAYDQNTAHMEEARRLAELVEAMDVWLKNGGRLPKEWKR
jgi:membrane-bound lytic murein transglycosylase MltF